MTDFSFLPRNLAEAQLFLKKQGLRDNVEHTRAKILCCWDSVDIQACPGSGKTTILVTKLAWAIENWKLDNAGICVLSHTNVAKEEIQKRLTGNQASKLFAYPHFVGTIHEFLNKFFAIPWLRANNKPIRYIDNDVVYQKCAKAIWNVQDDTLDNQYRMSFSHDHHVRESLIKLSWQVDNLGKFQLLKPDKKHEKFQHLIKAHVTKQGFHTHDDMIAFSKRLLHESPFLPSILQVRFPIVLIDEAQDTNESLSLLLTELFAPNKVIYQRYGDSDQQIFDFDDGEITAETFQEISQERKDLRIIETQRCSQTISTAASKLSLNKINIVSCAQNRKEYKPVLILFSRSKEAAQKVVAHFVSILPTEIKQREKLTLKALGQIGKFTPTTKSNEKDKALKFPRSMCDYEGNYLKPSNSKTQKTKTLYDAIANARTVFGQTNENYQAINIFFSSIVVLLNDYFEISNLSSFSYRFVKEQLMRPNLNNSDLDGIKLLNELQIIYQAIVLESEKYETIEEKIKQALRGNGFSKPNEAFFDEISKRHPQKAYNQVIIDDFHIELNTIAGVKGETHTATLVLETFFYGHNIENAVKVMIGGKSRNSRDDKRIKNLYVAMTRPTDFLCLAIPTDEYIELCKTKSIKEWFDSSFAVDTVLANNTHN